MFTTDKPKFSFGIDIGTSFSCVSYCDLSENPPYRLIQGVGIIGEDSRIPSVVLYNSSGDVVAIGETALEIYFNTQVKDSEIQTLTLVREFKAQFSEKFSVAPDKYIGYEKAYEAFLAKVVDELRRDLGFSEGRVCITHPARNKNENSIGPKVMELAAKVFGDGFVVEGLDEASSLVQFLDREEGFLSDKPRTILVIDSGGGTTDFALASASYSFLGTRKPLQIEYTDRRDKGGRNIDQKIYESAQNLRTLSITDPVQREKDLAFLRKNKESFNWDADKGHKLKVQVDTQFIEMSRKKLIEIVQPEIESMLEPIYSIKMALEKNKKLGDLDLIVIAGGNSLFPPFKHNLRKMFEKQVKIISVKDEDIKSAVAKGASLYINRTNRQIKFRLGYTVSIYNEKTKQPQVLWKQGTKFPPKNTRHIDSIITAPDASRIKIQREGEAASLHDLKLIFEPPIEPNTYITVRFEIDDNGYLRYFGEPFGKKFRSEQEIIRQFLFDTTQGLDDNIDTETTIPITK